MENNNETNKYNIVIENAKSTVVTEHVSNKKRVESYQSENDLENAFIKQLESQAYEYLNIVKEDDLILNLRSQLEKLNNISFSDNEWNYFFKKEIANSNQRIEEKTRTIQEDYIKILERDDGTKKNIYIIDKGNIHNNSLQVINQYTAEEGKRVNRYDVTILVNGLPLAHIELKRRGIAIQEAFNQINRYQNESFWAESGLFEYVQIFVISNGTHTKYYGNTTRETHVKDNKNKSQKKSKRVSNSFEFTSWWADSKNTTIPDLMDFASTFFAKHTFLNIVTRYCVFTYDNSLLVMRPYQIVATEKILNKIEISSNYKKLGKIEAGGYVWHTTGSGKTLTSFKTASIASKLSYVDKVLFVVDRKDLDHQTMQEYDKYEKNSADSNTSVKILKRQLEDSDCRIIITTIQKLDRFIKGNKGHQIFDGHIVIIFDECHRSQFGDMHFGISKSFKNYHLFGFTGTPIFSKNATSSVQNNIRTTEQAFGDKLHTYTIVDAINDKNVLPFKVDYVETFKEAENISDKKIKDIDRENALLDSRRIKNIVEYIREHFDQKTKRSSYYKSKSGKNLKGFNSIFAVSSIDAAKRYYSEFQKQMEGLPSDKRLKVATIYSFNVNEEDLNGVVEENSESADNLDKNSRDFLENAIEDYNQMFKTSYDTSSHKFQNYYQDVSKRVKDRDIDILIVVNMFLTGFDATTLNTLWVDKNLRMHGLLQAYSRTNRILNSVKTFGNIVCFRNLEEATNESIALFGDKEAKGVVLLKSYDDYYNGYKEEGKDKKGYKDLIQELQEKFPVGEVPEGEQAKKEFVNLYSSILKRSNILSTFDEFSGNEILSERDFQDYSSLYIDLYEEFKKNIEGDKENINDDLIFEMELIKQVEINIDYILVLIKKYSESNRKDKVVDDINKAIDSSIELRNKRDLINQFILSVNSGSKIEEDWHEFVESKKIEELEEIIKNENLNKEKTYKFIQDSFRSGAVETIGSGLAETLPSISRFSKSGERTKKRETVIEKLNKFFEKFFDISSGRFGG